MKKESKTSWEAVKLLDEAEIKINNAVLEIQNARRSLIDKLNEISGFEKTIKELNKLLLKNEQTIPINNQTLYKKLGINLSNSCIIMIKNNFTTPCPTYNDLLILDNSLPEFSGNFIRDNDGFFHREDPNYINSWRMYDFDSTPRMFVDPPSGMNSRVKLITIVPNFDNFFIKGDKTQLQQFEMINVTQAGNSTTKAINYSYQNQTQDFGRIIYHDRYVDNCRTAVIDAEDWELILVDTINYLRNGCLPEFTEFDNKEIIIDELTEIDITTSPNYQAKWKLEADMERCKVKC